MIDELRLPVVATPGLTADSLGNYLASLGLLRVLTGQWPNARIAWREGTLVIVGGPPAFDALLDELLAVAAKKAWTPYERAWASAQKKSTKTKSAKDLALWLAQADERMLELFNAHAVCATRVYFNPLLGSGGNAGRRDFADGWKRAINALADADPSVASAGAKAEQKRRKQSQLLNVANEPKRMELEALLLGRPVTWLLKDLNAASWFSDSNKLYNSGQKPYRDGALSPWLMALACEGLAFLAGGASRRLGARARAVGAFPFVTYAAAPEVQGEAGRDLAEVWAPIWRRPMTVSEMRTLFARGRAEVHGRGVRTPAAFATAIWRRGTDAGIAEFRRFVLGRTTSANTFEPRFSGIFPSPLTDGSHAAQSGALASTTADVFERILNFIERLPRDKKKGKTWQFIGLRGPVEAALLKVAADPHSPSLGSALLDVMVSTLDHVDRNRSLREKKISWQPLPIRWLRLLFSDELRSIEGRLALALVSAFPKSRPFALYRFGADWKYGRYEHVDRPPARWVWGPGDLPRLLSTVLLRRTFDWQVEQSEQRSNGEPVRFVMPASCQHVGRWLDRAVNEALLVNWISRLALFDWRFVPHEIRSLATSCGLDIVADGALALFGMIHPLFDLRPVISSDDLSRRDLLDPGSEARTPNAARVIANLIHVGRIDAAVRFARGRFSMAGAPLIKTDMQWQFSEPDRLLASMLFPIGDHERTWLVQRWLRPQRQRGQNVYD